VRDETGAFMMMKQNLCRQIQYEVAM
jgi:hypothetical protein